MATAVDEKNRKPLQGESKGAGVQSRRNDSAMPEVQPLDSVNAPKVTLNVANPDIAAPKPINTYEQTEAIRNENKAKAAKAAVAQTQPVTPAKQEVETKPVQATPATTETIKNTSPEYLKYEYTALDENAAEKKLKESDTFKGILKRAQDENEDYRKRSEKASKQAKMQAWGNMFSALGQLAGAGKNTYVAPDQTYLKSALSKADEARKMYDAIQAKNRDYETKYRAAFMENERKAHANAEKLKQGAIADYNKVLQKDAKDMRDYEIQVAKLKLKEMLDNNTITLKQYQAETARLNAYTAQKNAETSAGRLAWNQTEGNRKWEQERNKMFTYADTENGYMYRIPDGMMSQLAELMVRTGKGKDKDGNIINYDAADFGITKGKWEELKQGKLSIADLKDNKLVNTALQKFIKDNRGQNEELERLLEAADQEAYSPNSFASALGNPAFMEELGSNPEMIESILSKLQGSKDPAVQKIMEKYGHKKTSSGTTKTLPEGAKAL